jgi:hypothetical protein
MEQNSEEGGLKCELCGEELKASEAFRTHFETQHG